MKNLKTTFFKYENLHNFILEPASEVPRNLYNFRKSLQLACMPASVCKGCSWLGFDSGEIILKEASLGGLSTHTCNTATHLLSWCKERTAAHCSWPSVMIYVDQQTLLFILVFLQLTTKCCFKQLQGRK